MATCATCKHFAPLSPGHAAICFEKWRGLPWNAAVPLTTAVDTCDKHEIPRALDNGSIQQGQSIATESEPGSAAAPQFKVSRGRHAVD